MRASQALTSAQIGAMIGSADPKNPALVGVAGYIAKNVVDGNRASQELLLWWEEVEDVIDDSGKLVGNETHIGLVQALQIELSPCACEPLQRPLPPWPLPLLFLCGCRC